MLESFSSSLTWSSNPKLDGMNNMKEQWKLQASWKLKLDYLPSYPQKETNLRMNPQKQRERKKTYRWKGAIVGLICNPWAVIAINVMPSP
jgi:hypothetical protein